MGAAQTLAWPHPLIYISTKSTAVKPTPPMAGGALLSTQMLCRGWIDKASCWYKSMVFATVRRDFRFSSLTLGVSWAFSHPQSTGVCYLWRRCMGGDCGWSSIEPTWVVALPSAWGEGASTGGKGLQWWVFPLSITQQRRSALWWFRLLPQAFLFIELLPYPIPSGFLLTAHSSPRPESALQTPHFSTQPLSAAVDTFSG